MSLEILLIFSFLLLPPLVLWRCRRFCEKHPSTIPFRTVPLGCLTMFVAAALLERAITLLFKTVLERNVPSVVSRWGGPVVGLLALFLGLAVINSLSKRLKKGGKAPHRWLFLVVFAGLAAISMAIAMIFAANRPFPILPDSCDYNRESASWNAIFLGRVQNSPIAFEQRPIHPFLAEYDYRIRLGERNNRRYFRLWTNTGGRTYINVYRVSEDKLLLKDKDGSCLIDTTRMQVYLVHCGQGADGSESTILSAIPLSEKPFDGMGSREVYFADGTSAQAIPYNLDLGTCEYMGCIMDDSFYTPTEQPEGEGHPQYRGKSSTQDE